MSGILVVVRSGLSLLVVFLLRVMMAAEAPAMGPHVSAEPEQTIARRIEYYHHHPRPYGGWCRTNGWHTHGYQPQASGWRLLALGPTEGREPVE